MKALSEAHRQLLGLGFEPVEARAGRKRLDVLARIAGTEPEITGICEPPSVHSGHVDAFAWRVGPNAFVVDGGAETVVVECFFVLDSPDMPRPTISLRDHFDYGVEPELQRSLPDVSPLIGPQWSYVYECPDLDGGIDAGQVFLTAPLVGNALTCRSPSAAAAVRAHDQLKAQVSALVPVPLIWAYPTGLPLGCKNAIWDCGSADWWEVRVRGPADIPISLLDLASLPGSAAAELSVHSYDGTVGAASINLETVTLQFAAARMRRRRQRKLSRLRITFT